LNLHSGAAPLRSPSAAPSPSPPTLPLPFAPPPPVSIDLRLIGQAISSPVGVDGNDRNGRDGNGGFGWIHETNDGYGDPLVRAFDGIKAAVCDVAGPNVARMVSAGSNGGYGPWVGKQWDTPKVVTEGRVHYECTNSIGWAKSATASAFMQGNIPTYFELRAANEAPNQDGTNGVLLGNHTQTYGTYTANVQTAHGFASQPTRLSYVSAAPATITNVAHSGTAYVYTWIRMSRATPSGQSSGNNIMAFELEFLGY